MLVDITSPPPPQPMSKIRLSSLICSDDKAQLAMAAWPPPFIPLTIILPKNPFGLRVLLKIWLKSPIVCTIISFDCKIPPLQRDRQSP